LWNEKDINKFAYLHARSSVPQSIVFPTELILDETMFDPKTLQGFRACSEKFRQELSDVFRFKAIGQILDTITYVSEALQKPKKNIVWRGNLTAHYNPATTLCLTLQEFT
jgi:hypothetical protein